MGHLVVIVKAAEKIFKDPAKISQLCFAAHELVGYNGSALYE